MIYVQCIGGLGNRLFIYAFARSLQLDSGDPIVLYHTHQAGVTYYTQALREMLPPSADVTHISVGEGEPYMREVSLRLFTYRILHKLWRIMHPGKGNTELERTLQPWFNRMGLCVVTDGYLPFHRPSYLKDFVCLGYFQSRRYWTHHTDEIRRELRRSDLIAESSRSALDQIRSTNAVCLHIRLGDYVNDPTIRHLFYVCDEGYYQRAVQAALEQLECPVFFAFSNDPDKARQIPFPKQANIVWMPEGEAVSDLQLMAQCRHFIMANSSYSWWAQFLGNAPDKRVYAPERWFRTDKPADLYEDAWIKIPITPLKEVDCEN